eukprot:scaffold100095_cov16-Tisochrysis_lutea.AAC.4
MEPERAEEYQSTGSFPLPHTLLLLLVLPVNRASREAPGARPLLVSCCVVHYFLCTSQCNQIESTRSAPATSNCIAED